MFKVKCSVIETEENVYMVYIDTVDGVSSYKAADVYDAEMALRDALEYKHGDCDFDFVCCGVKDGVGCYVVLIDDYVW